MKPDLKLVEARGDEVTFTFGRFNPPTIGHEKLMDATKKIGRNYRVYASHSQDASKNPLDYNTKVKYMKRMFPKHSRSIKPSTERDAIGVAVKLYDEGFRNLTMVVGSDRVRDFQKLLDTYNGKKARHGFYDFKTIKVKSAGERDPDGEGVRGMSASKMRKAAQNNDYNSFKKGLPMGYRDGEKLFKDVQRRMKVKGFREWAEDLEEASIFQAIKIAAVGFLIPFVLVYYPSISLVVNFEWGQFIWILARLPVAVWLVATGFIGCDTRGLGIVERLVRTVSYTHLTLPTKA